MGLQGIAKERIKQAMDTIKGGHPMDKVGIEKTKGDIPESMKQLNQI
jgi:hypothetical protein